MSLLVDYVLITALYCKTSQHNNLIQRKWGLLSDLMQANANTIITPVDLNDKAFNWDISVIF